MILNKEDFERMADEVAVSYLTEKTPLNDSILKVADSHDMNPEQIKRLVEMSNVKTFLKLFDRPENKDTNIEFDVADHGDVMKKYYAPQKQISISKVTVTMAQPENDSRPVPERQEHQQAPEHNPNEFSGDLPRNFMEVLRHGELPKVAEEQIEPTRYDARDIEKKLRRIEQTFTDKIYEEEHEYIENLEKISSEFAKLYGPDYESFERDALCLYGKSAEYMLGDIRSNIHYTRPMYDLSKTAGRVIVDSDTPEHKTFSKMLDCKRNQVKYAQAIKITRQKMRGLK